MTTTRYCVAFAIAATVSACSWQQAPPLSPGSQQAQSADASGSACKVDAKLACEQALGYKDVLSGKTPRQLEDNFRYQINPTMTTSVDLGIGDPPIKIVCAYNTEQRKVVHSGQVGTSKLSESDAARLRVWGLCK